MNIIPVIDISDGIAVHARQGNRSEYRPVNSPLCPDADVMHVIDSYLSWYPFTSCYIADLDAIESRGNNSNLLETVLTQHDGLEIWLDAGANDYAKSLQQSCGRRLRPVIGTETGMDIRHLGTTLKQHDAQISFERCKLPCDRGLRHLQCRCCCRQRA